MSLSKSGIYSLIINNKLYVGSAVHIRRRTTTHIRRLKSGVHPNKHLQSAYNKYKSLTINVLEYCDINVLLDREELWIEWTKCYLPEFGYNKRRKPNSNLGLKFNEETRKKISISNIGKHGEKKPPTSLETRKLISLKLKGLKRSKETLARMSKSRSGEIRSHEQKLKISNSLKGNKNALGHTVSKEARLKMASARNTVKWPHEKGSLCKCKECTYKRSKASLIGYHRRNKNNFIKSLGEQISYEPE